MELTYYTSGGSGDAGDQYTGLDRFGRVVDQRWDLNGVDLERLKYGYDQVNNQVWRQNTVAEGLSANQDQYYTQDGLYQIKTLQRGTLNATQTGISGTPAWEEDWNYDPLGNWNGSTGAYQTRVAGTTTLNQNRTHSTVNEITNITESTGPAWPTPGYDAAGNMTSGPQPLSPANGYVLTYDAWNRLVQLQNGSMVVAAYAYDGASRRVTKAVGNTLRHHYYDDQWRVVEERLNAATTADRRFVWGIRRLDDLILRDQASAIRLYAVDDKINVTAVVDTGGTVQERYGYNGFGGVRYMDAGFNPIPASTFDWETLFDSYRYDADTGLYQVRFRYLHPLLGRWPNHDPINEIGFKMLTRHNERFNRKEENNLYRFVANNSVNCFDAEGLWVVCRRAVRVAPGEPSYYGWFAHVDIAEDCSKCGNSTADEDVSCYPILPDPKCKCAPDTAKCLKENPYSAGEGIWGSNCQSNTRDRLHKCCLIAPGWHPDFYAYPIEPPLGPAPPFL